MNRKTLAFIALAVSMLFGAGFAAFGSDRPSWYAPLGGVIVALTWIAVGYLGRDDEAPRVDPTRDAER